MSILEDWLNDEVAEAMPDAAPSREEMLTELFVNRADECLEEIVRRLRISGATAEANLLVPGTIAVIHRKMLLGEIDADEATARISSLGR